MFSGLIPSNESPSDMYSTSSSLQEQHSLIIHPRIITTPQDAAVSVVQVSPDQCYVVYEAAVPVINTRGSYSQF